MPNRMALLTRASYIFSKASLRCRDAEDDMMQSDAELGAMEEQMTTEVNREFDTDRTTDTTTHEDGKPVHVSKRRDWTP